MRFRLHVLVTPRVSRTLRLTDEQVDRIRDILAAAAKQGRQLMERVEGESRRRMAQVRKEIFEVLRPEQREAAEKMLRSHQPAARPHKGAEK